MATKERKRKKKKNKQAKNKPKKVIKTTNKREVLT